MDAGEKKRRSYYQSIVYDVCNLLDTAMGSQPGKGLVCGTVDNPSSEVQCALKELLGQISNPKG